MRFIVALLASTTWIGASEFLRNELLFKHLWLAKYESLGLEFPSRLANNALWGLWSLMLALTIAILVRRLPFWTTCLVAWLTSFAMMWVVIVNLNVMPFALLVYALPLSVVEVVVAALICRAIAGGTKNAH